MHVESASLPDSYADLKALTLSLIEVLRHKSLEVESLKFQLFQLRRWRFGAASEQLNAEQLALWQAELEADIAATESKLAEHELEPKATTPAKRVAKRETRHEAGKNETRGPDAVAKGEPRLPEPQRFENEC